MAGISVNLEYSQKEFPLILQNSYYENEFYGVSTFEYKKMKIILAKHGCQHCFHTLPSEVRVDLHPFYWDGEIKAFIVDKQNTVNVQLNQFEEAVVNYNFLENYF